MEMCDSIRRVIEDFGIETLNSKQGFNILCDYDSEFCSKKFIWDAIVNTRLFDSLLQTSGDEASCKGIALKFAQNTGFSETLVSHIIKSVALGVRRSFFGNFPPEAVDSISLNELHFRNKKEWNDALQKFQQGYFRAKKDGRYYFLAIDGKPFLNETFRFAGAFGEGLLCVNDGDKEGYINIRGNLEIRLSDLDAECATGFCPFKHGLAIFHSIKGHGLIDKTHQILKPRFGDSIYWNEFSDYVIAEEKQDSKQIGRLYSLCDKTGKSVLPQKLKSNALFNNSEQKVLIEETEDGIYVLINRSGKVYYAEENTQRAVSVSNGDIIILFKEAPIIQSSSVHHEQASAMCEFLGANFRPIKLPSKNLKPIGWNVYPLILKDWDGIFYFTDKNGLCFDNQGYDSAFPFIERHTWVKKGWRWSRLSKSGEILCSFTDKDVLSPEINGKILIRELSTGLVGVYDIIQGRIISIPDSREYNCPKIINPYRLYRIDFEHSSLLYYNGQMRLIEDKKAIISATPRGIILQKNEKGQYTMINPMHLDLDINVKLNSSPKIIMAYKDKFIVRTINNQTGWISALKPSNQYWEKGNDKKGVIDRYNFDYLSYSDSSQTKVVLVDQNLNKKSEAYDKILRLHDGPYYVFQENQKRGILDKEGKVVIEPIYIEPIYESIDYYKVSENE